MNHWAKKRSGNSMNHWAKKRSGILATLLVMWAALGAGCSGADGTPAGTIDDNVESTSQAVTVSQMQSTMDQFYDMNNVVEIRIVMDNAQWIALKDEQPMGGVCNFNTLPDTERFQWRPTIQVLVGGSSYLTTPFVVNGGVEIKKKSFCGSFTDGSHPPRDKPSLK
jgi:hypothetical protein